MQFARNTACRKCGEPRPRDVGGRSDDWGWGQEPHGIPRESRYDGGYDLDAYLASLSDDMAEIESARLFPEY